MTGEPMKYTLKACAAAFLVVLAPLTQAADKTATTDSAPIAIVNGHAIPAIYGELLKQDLVAHGQPDNAALNAKVKDSLITLELASQAAVDEGLDKNPRLAAVLEIRRKDQLAKAYIENYVKNHPVTETEIKTAYDKVKAGANGKEYKVEHILVKTEKEAKSIIAQLKKGAKFADLAKKKSIDPGSAKNGGELGWNVPSAFVKEFGDAISSMNKGETSKTPVKTQFGWHVIRVEDVRPEQVPPLNEVKDNIVHELEQERVREALEALRKGAKIE
jgi:peptidyl-prolyl cis-trans isomerase C